MNQGTKVTDGEGREGVVTDRTPDGECVWVVWDGENESTPVESVEDGGWWDVENEQSVSRR